MIDDFLRWILHFEPKTPIRRFVLTQFFTWGVLLFLFVTGSPYPFIGSLAVVFSSHQAGVWAGLLSSLWVALYALFFLANRTFPAVLWVSLCAPPIAILVSLLKRNFEVAIKESHQSEMEQAKAEIAQNRAEAARLRAEKDTLEQSYRAELAEKNVLELRYRLEQLEALNGTMVKLLESVDMVRELKSKLTFDSEDYRAVERIEDKLGNLAASVYGWHQLAKEQQELFERLDAEEKKRKGGIE